MIKLQHKTHNYKEFTYMIPQIYLKSNTRTKINFDGGVLSSDSGLLIVKEFLHKIG